MMAASASTIQGTTDPAFTTVYEAFSSIFADELEHGAAVAAMVDGKIVADLWGGFADPAAMWPWQRDTLVNVWSATKGVMSLAIAMLVERGKLRYDAPIADVWPEFAAGGKQDISLNIAMSHQAGLDGLSVPMDLDGFYAWGPYVEALAAMVPLWEPGSRCIYHALSFGHLTGEPLRRVDGRSPGRFVAEEIARVLDVPFFIGLPAEQDRRAAVMIEGPNTSDWLTETLASPYPHSCRNPTFAATTPNDRAWRAAEIPGANGQGDARGLATIYGSLVAGGSRLLSADGLAAAIQPRFDGVDGYDRTPAAYAAGFRLKDPNYGAKASARTFGHSGWGGTLAFADPEARVGFAFVTCHMQGFGDVIDPRRQRLVEALYDSL
ncbi:MAG TPA: serine hydrolase domain-containing protein [Terriglobales bacterium]|nr:serine hydrolase domain-containing protein [Terriglobales bacterium]